MPSAGQNASTARGGSLFGIAAFDIIPSVIQDRSIRESFRGSAEERRGMMRCPSCGHGNLDGALFCEQGAAESGPICRSCGTRNQVGSRFCRQCREPLGSAEAPVPAAPPSPTPAPSPAIPASFASGRYRVQRFIGEGGQKRVYLAHDTRLDRDVAFSVIKTEGLDASGLARVRREAQATRASGSQIFYNGSGGD